MEAVDRIRRVAAGKDTPDDRAWLSARLGAYLSDPEQGMERALRLDRSPGEPPWWRVERRQRRDALILRLWRERWPELSAWDAAERILIVQQRYAAAAWRQHRDQDTRPADPTAALLWEIMKTDLRFPTSRRRIFEILNTAERDALY